MLTNFKAKVIPFFSQLQKAYQLTDLKNPALLVKEKPLITTALFHTQKYSFSSYFNDLDNKDVHSYSERKFQNKKYRGLIDLWKKPLERKRKRQERIKQIKQQLPVPKQEPQKLVVHNSTVGIQYPPLKNQIFCVIKVDSFQYKVTEDCLLVLDTKEDHEINQTIKFNQVLLAGTPTYTVLGRPNINNTYVEGIIESISDSDKTIVFKKKRRKQYKKSFGSRVKLTTCRITRIVHQLTPQTLSQAVPLVNNNAPLSQPAQK